ncbi:hypothetical protein L6R52_07040 [Myxococcota bacterium]|nr:hypothetical protein [Myxococcota bacterium]
MILKVAVLEAIRRGEVSLQFRRWVRPTVKRGGTLTTALGVVAIGAVEPIDEAVIDDAAVRAAGFASRDALLASLAPEGQLYRIRVSFHGEDPRIALRDVELDDDALDVLRAKLARMDGRSPWTRRYLELIGRHEAVRAADLAAKLGLETLDFKAKVRRLKALGLTESLDVGYRLSARGRSYLQRTE